MFSTNNGYIARYIFGNNPRDLGLTLTVRRDCSCDIIIPFNVFSGVADHLLESLASKYEHAEPYVKLLADKGYWREDEWMDLDIVDLNPLLYLLIAITNPVPSLTASRDIGPYLSFQSSCPASMAKSSIP